MTAHMHSRVLRQHTTGVVLAHDWCCLSMCLVPPPLDQQGVTVGRAGSTPRPAHDQPHQSCVVNTASGFGVVRCAVAERASAVSAVSAASELS